MDFTKYFLICTIVLAIQSKHTGVEAKLKQEVLDEKVSQLMEWSSRRPVISFSSDKFMTYVKSKPRNYSMIVMFTALDRKRGCAVCEDASKEFNIVANSFRFSRQYGNQLFFVMIDFDDGSDIFQMMKLNSAPSFMHFPAKGKRKPFDTYDIQRQGYLADNIAKWIGERTDIQIRVLRPPNYTGSVVMIVCCSLLGGLLYVRRNSLDFLKNKNLWGGLSLLIVLGMTSGQMWNHIRGPPYAQRNPNTGSMNYIHGNSQGQFVAETHIVLAINAAISLGFILLNEAGKNNVDISKRRILTATGLGLVVFFFSLILAIFRRKYGGYPYSFIF